MSIRIITKRRVKIKDLIAQGLQRKNICSTLNIDIETYKNDIRAINKQGN